MKKLFSALFAAVVMAAGLVVATGGSASANCTPTRYSGCVATQTKATGPGVVVKRSKAQICATVTAKGSNAVPNGRVVIKVSRNVGGYFFKKVRTYNGGEVCAKTGRLNKVGGYAVEVKYKSPKVSTFINSSDGTGFDVVRP